MHIKNKRGQSTVEYILLVTAVIAIIIALVAGKDSIFQNKVNSTITTVVGDMDSGASTLSGSHAPTTSTAGSPAPVYNVTISP